MILSIDPGKTSGYAFLDMEGKIHSIGQLSYGSELSEWLFTESLLSEVKILIIENFRIRPGHNFSWQEMETIKVIGMFELIAYIHEMEVIKQEPQFYVIGAKWAGIKIPKDHSISHGPIAYAHATYYSHKVLKNPIPAMRQMQ